MLISVRWCFSVWKAASYLCCSGLAKFVSSESSYQSSLTCPTALFDYGNGDEHGSQGESPGVRLEPLNPAQRSKGVHS